MVNPNRMHPVQNFQNIKVFKSLPPPGDRRHKYQISSRQERDLKDLPALSECRRERD